MNIFEFADRLKPGNLAHIILEGGEHQYNPIVSIDIRPGNKRSLVVYTKDERMIIKADPAEINVFLLDNHGFLRDEVSGEYNLKLNNNTMFNLKKVKGEKYKWVMKVKQVNIKGNETKTDTVILGQFSLWYVVENFYETFTNKKLRWVQKSSV